MGRKRKGVAEIKHKLDLYLKEYELDELNAANDMASLTQMCLLEVNIDKLQISLADIDDPAANVKVVKDLSSALRDTINSWTSLQTALGIDRKKRQSEADETPLSYIEHLQDQTVKFLGSRLKLFKCQHCGQVLGKYLFYVNTKGEDGSLNSETVDVVSYNYKIEHECWKCGKLALDNYEREKTI